MQISAKIVLDSVSAAGQRITTMQLCYQRFIHSEFMTHRMFSRNAMSSRAVPVAKMIEQVRNDPAMPIHWGKNQPGMQAKDEIEFPTRTLAQMTWRDAANAAANIAGTMNDYGLHKQVVNRILEPFQWMHVVVTATEWDNFFMLRLHEDAEPNIQELARCMKQAMEESSPVERGAHLPYVNDHAHPLAASLNIKGLGMISAARCARVSYLNHDGTNPDWLKDMDLALKLQTSRHASPFEHAAFEMENPDEVCANLRGWCSLRTEMAL